MNRETLAALINGREYRNELTSSNKEEASKNGLIVIYGCSEDLLEFEGAAEQEIGAWEGVTAFIFKRKDELVIMDEEDYEEEQKTVGKYGVDLTGNKIEAIWSPDDPDCSWLIKTDLPHSTFDIMEDGDLYCRGIVISVSDLK